MIVVKVGGSLLDEVGPVMEAVGVEQTVVIPGGGEFANHVRDFCSRYTVSDQAAHRMAILSMHQYGLYLAEVSDLRTIESLAEAPGILLPVRVLGEIGQIPNSWSVTSDSIAAFVAAKLQLPTVRLIKRWYPAPDLIHGGSLTTDEWRRLDNDAVDPYLPNVLDKFGIACELYCADDLERFTVRYAMAQPDIIIRPRMGASL